MYPQVITLFLRRMRVPLVVVISAYSIAVLGFTLIPGVDDQGEPWRMSFFEAFYVVSYTGSTIGFGEIPYEFSSAQRMWSMASIYLTVFAWLYAVGTLIALLQDPGFRQALIHARLQRSLNAFSEPFYLVCGYGDTGRLLVRSLIARGRRVVVIDQDTASIEQLGLRDLGVDVPGFDMDAGIPANLVAAGLQHRWCVGVLAVTDDDHTNLQVAIAAKLLNARVKVCCRARSAETMSNMTSFGTNAVVNADGEFAERLVLALNAPDSHRVYDWLSALPGKALPEREEPPTGTWILCGYTATGCALHRRLVDAGIRVVVVEEYPDYRKSPRGTVPGKGTEAATLTQAGIEDARALVAATPDDADNLSILMTARDLRPDLYMIAVENRLDNKALFEAAAPELVVQASYIVTTRLLSILGSPLLEDFLARARRQDNAWNRELAERIQAISKGTSPDTWTVRISDKRTPAIMMALQEGQRVTLESFCRDPRQRERILDCLPLMLQRGDRVELLPAPETLLESGDRFLFCGHDRALDLMRWNAQHLNALRYVHAGEQRPDGWLWRVLLRSREQEKSGPG